MYSMVTKVNKNNKDNLVKFPHFTDDETELRRFTRAERCGNAKLQPIHSHYSRREYNYNITYKVKEQKKTRIEKTKEKLYCATEILSIFPPTLEFKKATVSINVNRRLSLVPGQKWTTFTATGSDITEKSEMRLAEDCFSYVLHQVLLSGT